jgi:SAM-dependent methyltransferase
MRARRIVKRVVPRRARESLRARTGRLRPPVGWVRFGSLRRLTPISRNFGFDRGHPVDRYYIDMFLGRYAGAGEYAAGGIRGRVLEVGEDQYARKFGGPVGEAGGVESIDVLDVGEQNPKATIIADLTAADHVPSDSFDCVICTQTLSVVWDVPAAIRTLHRVLKPGGVLLVTMPGITRAITPDKDFWGDFWRFTTQSARRLFEEAFPPDALTVESYGNVLTAVAFLHGIASEELTSDQLEPRDPDYEVLVAVRAIKPG